MSSALLGLVGGLLRFQPDYDIVILFRVCFLSMAFITIFVVQ